MEKIRFGVFETNSSSTHNLSIVSKDMFEAWKNGDLLYLNEKLITEEEARGIYEKDRKKWYDTYEKWCEDGGGPATYDVWENDDELEIFIKKYTSESGDEIVVFGKYGTEY